MNYIPRADKIIIPITGFEPTAVSSESVAIPAGAAGSVVNFFLTKKPILDSHDSWFGGKGDTSLALTSATFTNEVSPFTADEDLANGDYWIDYITGKGRGKKANTSTSMTANYSVGSALGDGGGGGGLENPMPNGTFLQTIDKDDNQINLAGYAGEIIIFGDTEFGNQVYLGTQATETVEGVDLSYFSVYENNTEGFGAELSVANVDDPESPIQLAKYSHEYSLFAAELKAEFSQSTPQGYVYQYITRSDAVAGGDTLQDFVYGGYNSVSDDIIYARKQYLIEVPTDGLESAIVIDSYMKGGALRAYIYANESGITIGDVDQGYSGISLSLTDTTTSLGDYSNVTNGTHLLIDDANEEIFLTSASKGGGLSYNFTDHSWRLGSTGDGMSIYKSGTDPFGPIDIGDEQVSNNFTVLRIDDTTQTVSVRDSNTATDIVSLSKNAASNFTLGLKTRFSTAPMAGANPTNAEAVVAFGPATGMQGYIGIWDTNANETDIYIVTVGGANDYFFVKFIQAA